MKPKVYIETSIVSYLTARPSKNLIAAGHQLITAQWRETEREMYNLLTSDLVLAEASAGDQQMSQKRLERLSPLPLLATTEAAEQLTQSIITSRVLPENAAADAAHISIAAVNELDYLLTWNCTHIANAKIFPRIFEIIKANGYRPPILCTPLELLGGYDQ